MREVISTDQAPAAIGPYSQAVLASGEVLFLSGQIPSRPDGTLVTGSIADQTRQALTNLREVLAAAGMSLADVVKTTVLLTSMDHFPELNAAYAEFFPEAPPARATFAVVGLPRGVDVEIEAIAVRQ